MKITVRLFARARDLAGREICDVDLPDGARVADLRRCLGECCPGVASLLPHLFIAVNEEYARDDDVIPAGAKVACFPPVSGG